MTTIDHCGVRADLLHLTQQVARKKNGCTAVRDAVHEQPHLAHLLRVEAGRGLVEDQQVGLAEERLSDPEALLHPVRIRLHLPADRASEVGDFERAVKVGLVQMLAAGAPEQLEVLQPG